MIQKIRRRFIRIALCVLAGAMITVSVIINAANLVNVRTELRETLEYIAQSGNDDSTGMGMGMKGGRAKRMRNALSESRYFSATVSSNGRVTLGDTGRESDVTSDELTRIVNDALLSKSDSGYCENYIYTVNTRPNGSRTVFFLNMETKLAAIKMLAIISAAACAGGIALAWLLVGLFSRRAIRPLIQSAIQQKRFITDAGHELKTPLTVIGANMDVLSQDLGENEWVKSTQKQTARMGELVNQLVYLSRMDEDDAGLAKSAFDVTAAVRDVCEPFAAMAEFAGKGFSVDVPEGLTTTGDEAAIRRLVTILCDNAVKYAPEGDQIILRARAVGKKLSIETDNAAPANLTDESLAHLFDRFYRADSSRSKETVGGTGLGLAIARAISEKHQGSVKAYKTAQGRLRIACTVGMG